MNDRFDLEQGIIGAWGIIDDLKACKDMDELKAITDYYNIRFERLWETFENVLGRYQFVEKKQGTDTF